MKRFLKRFFIFLVCYELFFFFYKSTNERLFEDLYTPIDIQVDTMDFSNNLDKKNGIELFQNEDYWYAIPHLKRAFKIEPNNYAIIFALATCKLEVGEPEAAHNLLHPWTWDPTVDEQIRNTKNFYSALFYKKYGGFDFYWVNMKLESLIKRDTKYKNLAEDFLSRKEKWSILDFFNAISMQERIEESLDIEELRGWVDGFSNLEGVENNRAWMHFDSISNSK